MELIEELKAKRQWTEEEAREVIEALKKSRETVGNFSQQHGLRPGRIYWWLARLEKTVPEKPSKLDNNTSAVFVPMTIRLPDQAPCIIARVNRNSVQIKLPSDTNSATWIANLVRALEKEA